MNELSHNLPDDPTHRWRPEAHTSRWRPSLMSKINLVNTIYSSSLSLKKHCRAHTTHLTSSQSSCRRCWFYAFRGSTWAEPGGCCAVWFRAQTPNKLPCQFRRISRLCKDVSKNNNIDERYWPGPRLKVQHCSFYFVWSSQRLRVSIGPRY